MAPTSEWMCGRCGSLNGRDMTAIPWSCPNCGLPYGVSYGRPVAPITDAKPVSGYGVRKCRGHWHVTHCGDENDVMVPGDPFDSLEAALDAANALKASELQQSPAAPDQAEGPQAWQTCPSCHAKQSFHALPHCAYCGASEPAPGFYRLPAPAPKMREIL